VLREADWFSRVGVRDTFAAVVLASWEDAMELRGSIEWGNLRLEMVNDYHEQLDKRSREKRLKWNQIVDELKETLIPFVAGKVEHVARDYRLPKGFEHSVQWDILHFCMEMEYADVYPPGFYANLASWYGKGHFPCGWQGVFPAGMLIIY
jgi:hypothetical protein